MSFTEPWLQEAYEHLGGKERTCTTAAHTWRPAVGTVRFGSSEHELPFCAMCINFVARTWDDVTIRPWTGPDGSWFKPPWLSYGTRRYLALWLMVVPWGLLAVSLASPSHRTVILWIVPASVVVVNIIDRRRRP